MGSPSRNVQYHPPRLSEDRLNLPQPHSPSLPTHCSGKSGMRPRAVLVRVPARPQLLQRRARVRAFRHLELEEVDVFCQPHRQVHPAAAGRVLRRHAVQRRLEPGVEHARPVTLVAGDLVSPVPVVRDACQQPPAQRLHACPVLRRQQPAERAAVSGRPPPVRRQRVQQALVQSLPDLAVRIAQAVLRRAVQAFLFRDRQVAGLEQQRLGGDAVHVEGRQQRLAGVNGIEVRGGEAAPEERVDQETRRRRFEPVRLERAAAEQHENAEGVVDLLRSQPVVAVVPGPDQIPVQARQFRREDRVDVRLGIAADRRVAGVQGDVDETVEVGEQADLGELAHPGDEGELHVSVAVLDRAVQAAQVVTVRFRDIRLVQRVQNRFVVLVHQHDHPPARLPVQRGQEAGEAPRHGGGLGNGRIRLAFDVGQLLRGTRQQLVRPPEVAGGEAQAHDGMAPGPVPAVVHGQVPEQRLVALVQLLEGVHEQALAEAPRARQEIVLAGVVRETAGVGSLVDVVVALLPDLTEGLYADGEPAPVHGCMIRRRTRSLVLRFLLVLSDRWLTKVAPPPPS